MDEAGTTPGPARLGVLDGWRGISILLVLCAHLLPLGPREWDFNFTVATTGMVLFFTLSGFLITRALLRGMEVRDFLVRRFCRIVPLAWLFMLIVLICTAQPWSRYPPHLLFYGNLPPFYFFEGTGHLWSLCVEMQFYVMIAVACALLGRRNLPMVVILGCLLSTGVRIYYGAHAWNATFQRVDEILAGGVLAVAFQLRPVLVTALSARPWLTPLLFCLTVVSAAEASGPFNYLRPYLSAACVASTLFQRDTRLVRVLNGPTLAWLAGISFALYVIHGGLTVTWLGGGEGMVKYAKRPLFFAVLFALAYVSTRYYEQYFMAWGKSFTRRAASKAATRQEIDGQRAI